MPTACLPHQLHHITVIIVIVIVHFLFKRNVYLSLLCDLYVFFLFLFFLVLEIIFFISSSNCAVERCDIFSLLIQHLPCFAYLFVLFFLSVHFHPLLSIFWSGFQISAKYLLRAGDWEVI
jgi:hypothetical protein